MMVKLKLGAGAVIVAFVLLYGSPAAPQTAARRAASPTALLAFPGFFQGQPVVVRGTLSARDQPVLTSPAIDRAIPLIFSGGSPADGPVELRATFFDIGRLQRDDPRIENLRLASLLPGNSDDEWPRPGQLIALVVTDAVAVKGADETATPRLLALDPQAFAGKQVTVTGQFRGRNLYGDLPQAPGLSQWDFVLHSGDGSVWITGQRPRGRGFNLDVSTRTDTRAWLQVTGTVREARGMVWIEAARLVLAKPETGYSAAEPPRPPEIGPAPEVIFSDPQDGDIAIELDKEIRLQFSRDMNPDSFKGNVLWHYVGADPGGGPPQANLSVRYDAANRSLEIKIDASDVAKFRSVFLELTEAVTATDGAHLKPWSVTFTFGGQ